MKPLSYGFAPIASPAARVLILGSLPGEVSIKLQQYYAQPRNSFWKIMGDLFGALPTLPYLDRISVLLENDIAVWDVCAAAHRPGSLDASIHRSSVEPNDFAHFLPRHPEIRCIFFNGAKAAALFESLVVSRLNYEPPAIARKVLPSTSAAHASMSYEGKKLAWEAVREQTNTSALGCTIHGRFSSS
jgi:double-stranded uracil-DNA glycosylase